MPGFRPGKVPLKMVAQQYGPQVRSDVIADAVQTSFNEAVREQNLRVAGYPRIEPQEQRDAGGRALEFSAVFEVYPEVTIGDLSRSRIQRPQVEVTPADVDRTLDVLRKQRAMFAPVERAAQTGDRVVVDFTGTIDGVEFAGGQAKDFAIELGEGRMLPEFEAAVPACSAGETQDVPADLSRRLSRQGSGRKERGVHADGEGSEPAERAAARRARSRRPSASRAASVDDLRAEVEAEPEARAQAQARGAWSRSRRCSACAHRRSSRCRKSLLDVEAQQMMQRMAATCRSRE